MWRRSEEFNVTSPTEEALQFDDDNLRGEEQHAVSLSSIFPLMKAFPTNRVRKIIVRWYLSVLEFEIEI